MATRGCSWEQGGHPKLAASAPNSTHSSSPGVPRWEATPVYPRGIGLNGDSHTGNRRGDYQRATPTARSPTHRSSTTDHDCAVHPPAPPPGRRRHQLARAEQATRPAVVTRKDAPICQERVGTPPRAELDLKWSGHKARGRRPGISRGRTSVRDPDRRCRLASSPAFLQRQPCGGEVASAPAE